MPRRIQLPNGRWVTVPDMDPYVQQIMDRRRGLEEEEEDEGTLAGSAWEGIKSIPSGVADIFYSGLQASIGVATPFADLPVERRLREQASKRARERDPAYQDAFLPAVGTGVGQVAGLSAISRLPYGWQAAVGAGVAMGISDQTRRIADYEQKTGTDVPWYNESAAHLAGALIGLSEVIPIKFGMFPTSVSKMMTRMKGGVTPNAGRRMSLLEQKYGLGAAASMAMQEATQEASAQWLQSVTARGLYDPDAMQDLAHSMAEDFKVGGAVGGLVKLVQHQMLNPRLRTADRDLAVEGSLRSSRGRNYALARELDDNITGITRELPELLTNVGVNPILARDIGEQFGGINAAIPRGMDELLKSGSIMRSDVRQLVVDLQTRTDRAKSELDSLIQHRPASRQEYEKAKAALDVMTADRIKNLSRIVTELRGGLGDMGGLTGNEQYQEARQADLESDTGATRETVMGVYETRKQARLNPDDPNTKGVWSSFKSAIRSLMGGSFGVGGFYQMAENLGVRRGPGSEKINLGVDPNLALSDMGLASSDRSSFDAAELGGVIFGGRGDHSSSTPQRKVDNSDVMDNLVFPDIMLEATRGPTGVQLVGVRAQLKALEERKAKLEKQIDNLYEKHPFTREMDEIVREEKHADDESWVRSRDLSQEFLLKQTQMVKANISQLNRERNDIYLRLLNQRLQQAQDYFAVKGNLGDKQSAAKRVLGNADVRAFDTWLNGTIASVNQSQINGQNMAQLAADQRAKFEAGLAAETDISKDAKAALTVKFLSQNAQEFGTQPRDISARQFMQVANLFGADSKVVKARAQGAFALKALSDIARWQVDDRLYDVTVDGLPDINESAPVVKQFLSKLEGLVTDKKTGKVSLEEGKPGYISDGDIVELLRSKNIYLRDETRIGESLAKQTKTGVKSKPFEKLLLDMTGALSWEKATYSQRLLMYSRLLQLPAHYTARGNPEEQRFLEGKGELDYRPLFLPDFYNDPSIDSHTDFMIDEVANITDQGHHKWPSRTIGTLKAKTQAALGKEFDSESFYEALARLIETGVFNPTDSAAPDVIISPDSWFYTAPTDESQFELGQDAGGLGDPIAEVPTRATWVSLLNSYGVDQQKPSTNNYGESKKGALPDQNPQFPWGTAEATPPAVDIGGSELSAKWAPVIKKLFPEVSGNIDVEFVEADHEALAKTRSSGPSIAVHRKLPDGRNRIFISYGKVQKLFQHAKKNKKVSVRNKNPDAEKYLRHIKDINKEFLDADELLVFVLAHEIAHEKFPRTAFEQETGLVIYNYNKQKNEWESDNENRAAYENRINEMALVELNRYMKGQSERLYDTRKREDESKEGERQASAVSNSRVRLNVEYKPLEDPWAPTSEGMTQPGDTRVQDEEFWVRETKPQLVNRLLTDPDAMWAGQVDELWARYNEKNTGKPISREDFVKRSTALITSTSMLQELSDMEVLDTVRGVVARGKTAPTEDLLELGTAEGRSLVQSLIKAGALPSSLQDDIHARRRRFVDTMTKRFEILDAKVEEVFKSTRLPDNIQRQYVDDLDGLYQFHRDVAIGGKRMEGVRALYDAPGNRIIINLALVDPNDMASAQEVVKDAAFHEGLHALIMRDHLLDEELKTLRNFVRNQQNIVPKEVDPDAHDAKVTWFERAIAQHKDSQLTEGDIENEAIVSLLQNMVRNPDAYVAGKKTRKIGDDLRGFLEKFVGAAKDADIVDVMRILGRIERGEVGERGSGFGFIDGEKYTDDSIIRSNMLLRYANPAEIKELRKAIVLRDAAPSDGMRQSEQAKVDAIADRITNRREIIQGSAGPPPSAVTNVDDERILHEHINATARGSQPLLALRYGKKDPEAYKLALNTFIETRNKDPEYAYRMPAEYQTLFDNKGDLDQPGDDTRKRWIDAGWVTPIDADATRKSVKRLSDLDNKTGDTVEETEGNFTESVDKLRYLYLDRRQWVVKQTDRLLAAQNRAELDAETSALVMWRNSDNALNWLPGLMLRGPLSYLGTSVGSGRFENAPVYDNDLAEKFGGDGRIGGLNEIFAPIIDSKDQELATIYGAAKRILWTKKRRDALRSATGQYGPLGDRTYDRSDLDPSTRLKLEKFEAAYVAINENDRISEDELNQTIRDVEEGNPHIVEFWDRYNAYDNHMIKMSYNTGMITREVRDEWMAMPYAPFYRDVATEEDFPVGSRQEVAKRGKNLVEKALKGSTGPIKTSLADGIIQNTQALVRDAMMNAAVSRTVRDAVSLGEARKIKISALEGVLDNRVVRVMEEGVPVFYELDDAQLAMSTMLLGYNPKKQLQELFGEHKAGELAQKLLTGSSELLREAVTRTPPFALKNVFRDSWNAMSLTGGGPKLVLQAFKNAFDVDILRRADEAGLSIGVDFVAEPGRFGEKMKKELDKANLDWKDPRSPFAALWNFTGRIAKQSEVSTRLAVYDRVLAMTGNKSLAQYYAIEIMNYGRRGSSATLSTWMSTVPFMNGRMQGLDVTYRGLRGKKGSSDIPGIAGYGLTADQYEDLPAWQKSTGSVLGRGLILTAATGALYLLMRDDEEWQDLRDETKSDNWVLPLSDHAWLKIPIPFEIGVIFKVIPEKILEAIFEKDVGAVDVGEEAYRQLRTSLSIGGPQLFAPVVNAMRNYDTFRKDDIVDHWMEETLSPNEQRNSYTSNVARGMADLANSIPLVKNLDFLTSPMKVEYMMRQYGGTMGGYVITAVDRIARTGPLADESVVGTNKDFDFRSMVGGEGVANVPILGDLLTDPRGRGGRQQEFYEALEELDLVVATLRSITERDHQRGFTYAEKHAGLLENQSQLRSIGRQLKEWREDRDYLAEIPRSSMSDDRKRESYKRLLEDRQYILRDIDALMESINRR